MTSATPLRLWITTVAMALAAAALGGYAGRASAPAVRAAAHDDARPAVHTLFAGAPSIVVTPDGLVTAHVEQQRVQWVLAELRDQAAAAHVALADDPARPRPEAVPTVASTAASAAVPGSTADLRDRLRHGDDAQRYDAVLAAQNTGALTREMLEAIALSDASPQVRMLAFEDSLESTAGDPAARRHQLETASRSPDAAIAQEAAQRLDAMTRAERPFGDAQLIAVQR